MEKVCSTMPTHRFTPRIWLVADYAPAAHLLLGQCARYDLGNIYDPAYTMVCRVSKRLLTRTGRG